jgi:hypothetical protein
MAKIGATPVIGAAIPWWIRISDDSSNCLI